jgi:hypothetical protein
VALRSVAVSLLARGAHLCRGQLVARKAPCLSPQTRGHVALQHVLWRPHPCRACTNKLYARATRFETHLARRTCSVPVAIQPGAQPWWLWRLTISAASVTAATGSLLVRHSLVRARLLTYAAAASMHESKLAGAAVVCLRRQASATARPLLGCQAESPVYPERIADAHSRSHFHLRAPRCPVPSFHGTQIAQTSPPPSPLS